MNRVGTVLDPVLFTLKDKYISVYKTVRQGGGGILILL